MKHYKAIYNQLLNLDIVIIDDFLYADITKEDLNLLYKSIMFFNESRSIIFISNRQVDKWKDATDDKYLIQTFIDRIKEIQVL